VTSVIHSCHQTLQILHTLSRLYRYQAFNPRQEKKETNCETTTYFITSCHFPSLKASFCSKLRRLWGKSWEGGGANARLSSQIELLLIVNCTHGLRRLEKVTETTVCQRQQYHKQTHFAYHCSTIPYREYVQCFASARIKCRLLAL